MSKKYVRFALFQL